MAPDLPPAPQPEVQPEVERAAADDDRIDRRIPGFLIDSPISHAGAAYASVVGALWGGLWSTGRVERHGELWVFRGMPRHTFRRGGMCVGRCYLTGSAPLGAGVLRHEAVHARQWRRFGLLMPVLNLLAGSDPLHNRFEIEAGLADGNYL